jgi:hypothetical protein
MDEFKVWITPRDGATSLRVDGLANTNWLLTRLSDCFVFKTCEPLRDISNTSAYTFLVAYNSQLSGRALEKLLRGISEVKLIVESVDRVLAN